MACGARNRSSRWLDFWMISHIIPGLKHRACELGAQRETSRLVGGQWGGSAGPAHVHSLVTRW